VNPDEVEQFSRIAEEWWDPHGKFKPLHQINPARLGYLREQICRHFKHDTQAVKALSGLRLLDIGCGGGLICEPMARMGAAVTGIDASEKNIKTACVHAQQSGLNIDYRAATAESMQEQFDVVLALEIIEHVEGPEEFIRCCAALVKPGGLLIMSTLNRTAKSFAMAIVGAEYVLRLLPRGTHQWKKFIRPDEMSAAMSAAGLDIRDTSGLVLNPLRMQWQMHDSDTDVNYLMTAVKPA
jgi:2-polyprenyl-6-hydroxyphenyl methylase/3-demethylubiquinone-9 3-methyltransferase